MITTMVMKQTKHSDNKIVIIRLAQKGYAFVHREGKVKIKK